MSFAIVIGTTMDEGQTYIHPPPAQAGIIPCGSPWDCIRNANPQALWDTLDGAAAFLLATPPATSLAKRISAGLLHVLRAGGFIPRMAVGCLVSVPCAIVLGVVGGIIVLKAIKHYEGGEHADTEQYITYVGNQEVLGPSFKILAKAPVHEDYTSLSMCNKVCQGLALGGTIVMSSGYHDAHLTNVRWAMKQPAYNYDRNYDEGANGIANMSGLPSDFVSGAYWVLSANGVSDTAGVPSSGVAVITPGFYNYGVCRNSGAPSCLFEGAIFPYPAQAEYSCQFARTTFASYASGACAASPVPTADENQLGLKVDAFLARQMWRQYGPQPPYCFVAQSGYCQPGENPDSHDLVGQLALMQNSPSNQYGCSVAGCTFGWARWATPQQIENALHATRAAPTAPAEPLNGEQTVNVPAKATYGSSSEYTDVRDAVGEIGSDAAKWIASQLPDSPYADPTGTPTDFTMPQCRGGTVASCQAAVSEAFVDHGVDAPTFAVSVDTVFQPDVPIGNVNTTNPAGTALVTAPYPATVSIETNPDPLRVGVILLPQPELNEHYADYLQRLRNLGWLGSAQVVTLTEEAMDTQVGPNAISNITVKIGAPEAWPVYATATWPDPWPEMEVGTPIKIEKNPSTAPPVEEGGGGGGSCCPTNAIDFDPLAGIACTDKFPCGLFAYAAGVVAMFNVAPDAPHFEFENLAGTTTDYNVDLEILDPYVAMIRTLLTFCMWIGAVWFIAARMLKIESAGDPGAAVDEAI